MGGLSEKLRICGIVLALITASSFAADVAKAQNASADQNAIAAPQVEQVVITGTSIHGQAPIGTNLISVTDVDMQNLAAVDVMDVFRDMPAISNFGAPPQGNLNNTYFMPNIHQLGASASNTTLVLIDGARVPLGGTLHALSDPGMVPEIAIQRIDVLATGASATYGSDAVAGVVNFITRASYDGLLIQGQAGTATAGGYMKDDLGLLWGTHWGDGNVYIALQYSYDSSLRDSARPFLFNENQTALATANGLPVGTTGAGATNFNNFQCNTVTIQPAGSSSIYVVENGGTVALANTAANSPCNMQAYNDELPSELRESARVQVTQEFGPLEVKAALNYSYRADHAIQAVGGLSGTTVFGTGPQANPFFQLPAGYTGTATSEVVRWDADALLGCCATNDNGQGGGVTSDFYFHTTSTYHMDHFGDFWKGFNLTWDNVLGQDHTNSNVIGALCGSCANLALNGTTNNSGSLTQVSVPGTTQLVTQLPLTASNALDVWDSPGSTNKTSSNVLASLGNSTTLSAGTVSTLQERLVLDGSLFDIGGGPVKIALGGEFMRWTDLQDYSQPNNTGSAAFGGSIRLYESNRTQAAYFGELNIPIVGPQNALPFVQKLDVDIDGRYDTLSDVGHTTNPKYAVDWTVVDGVTLKANYSTAFVPPSLISVGAKSQNYLWTYASLAPETGNINVPVALFPQIAGVLPGCAVGAVSCQLTSTTPGIDINAGGGTSIKPATGDDWTVGADISPSFLPGLNMNITLWNNHVKGLITSPSLSLLFQSAQLASKDTTVCPAGCTPAQVAAFENIYQGIPVSGTIPSTIYYMTDGVQQNIIFLHAEGIDASATYNFDTDFGHFTLADSFTQFLQFDYANGPGAPFFPIIGTAGYSNTFPALAFFDTGRVLWADPSDTYEVGVFVDFEAGYRNWSANSVTPITHDANGNPNGGGDPVKSSTLFDIHLAYNFPDGALEGDQLYFDGKDIFDWNPPFYNAATGYNNVVSNPIGRLLSIGFRAKL